MDFLTVDTLSLHLSVTAIVLLSKYLSNSEIGLYSNKSCIFFTHSLIAHRSLNLSSRTGWDSANYSDTALKDYKWSNTWSKQTLYTSF